jgi:hypothetical protein
MAVGGVESIGRKFFFTNTALDFVVAVEGEAGFRRLATVVGHQAKLAESALKILDRKLAPRVLSWQNGRDWDWAPSTGGDEDEEEA